MDPELDEGEIVVGRVTVYRILEVEGDMRDEVYPDDGNDEDIDVSMAVGMLAIAQHRIISEASE